MLRSPARATAGGRDTSGRFPRRWTAALALPAACALAFAGAAVPAQAATVTVTSSAELVQAVTDANLNPDGDTIVFGSNITLSASLPVVTTAVTVEGAGFTLSAAGFSAFDSNVGDLIVRDLTIGGSDGPAIRSVAGRLTVENVTVTSSDVVGVSTSTAGRAPRPGTSSRSATLTSCTWPDRSRRPIRSSASAAGATR